MTWEQVAELIDGWVRELDPGAVRSTPAPHGAESKGGDGGLRLGA